MAIDVDVHMAVRSPFIKVNVNPAVPGRTVCRDAFLFGGLECSHHACELTFPACIYSIALAPPQH